MIYKVTSTDTPLCLIKNLSMITFYLREKMPCKPQVDTTKTGLMGKEFLSPNTRSSLCGSLKEFTSESSQWNKTEMGKASSTDQEEQLKLSNKVKG